MATSKKAAVKKAGASSSTALVPWTERFSKYAKEGKEQVANIGSSGQSITWGHGKISIGDQNIANGKMECIILGSCALNRWNKMKYDAKNPQPPDCFAFALVADDPEMAPHLAATNRQSEKCAECDLNKFGTAETGKGKACSNTMRMGIFVSKDTEDAMSISTAELYTAGVSPTNLKHYKKYLDSILDEYDRPLWAVVTEITAHDDNDTQIRLEFKLVELIEDDDILTALEKRFLKVQETLQKPFSAPREQQVPAGRGSSKTGASQKFAKKAPSRR